MTLLLDTHVVLWWLEGAPLSDEALASVGRADTVVFVSAASAWEMGIKASLGKLRMPEDLGVRLEVERFTALAVTVAHGLEVATLPALHSDPFDRLLVAQARLEGLTLVTRDERLGAYGVPILAA